MELLKQVLGIDVAQKELVVCLGRLRADLSVDLYASKVFQNRETGFTALVKWVKKHSLDDLRVQFVMEATGVYHQKFAYYLDANNFDVSIVLPNKISNYMRTLANKTITDKTCAEAIAQFGLERKLDCWKRPKAIYKNLQQLTRERDQILEECVMAKNQLHAENTEAEPNANSLKRIKARIKFLSLQEKEIKQEIEDCINKEESLKKEVDIITTIPGIGRLTAVIVLAETNGFELIKNKRQLVSYSGLDIKEKQSGTSIKGKPRISKKGNKHLRKAMHMPALTAIRHDERYKNIFVRLVSTHGIKMKAVVAVQRKMLEMIYTIYKTKKAYDKNYMNRNEDIEMQSEAME